MDRSEDDADTDVEPAEDDAPITSLRDIKAKYAEGDATDSADSSTDAGDSTDEADDSADEADAADEAEDEPEEKPKPTSSGEAHQPKTDAEIKEGGSLFDL